MAKQIKRHQEDSETVYRLLRQAIRMTETVAQSEYPLTSYLLRVALEALEDETMQAIKEAAEIEMRYSDVHLGVRPAQAVEPDRRPRLSSITRSGIVISKDAP